MAKQSSQANFDAIKDADAHAQGLDGGLNLKTDAGRLASPATTRSDNAWYENPGNVGQLPAFASTMQPNTSHVYNVHVRDLQQPASTGDTMVHGEVRDTLADPLNYFTSPIWTDGGGATLNTQQPCLPVNLRTRILTGRQSVAGALTTDTSNMMLARQEAGFSAAAPQRYALAYNDTNTLNVTFGLVDGQIETPETLSTAFTADYCEIAGVQQTSSWIVAGVKGSTLKWATYDFKGGALNSGSVANVLAYNNAASGQYAPMTLLQHGGRTFIGYITNPSGAACVATLLDVLTQTTVALPLSSAAVPSGGFCMASPYSHVAPPGAPFYLGVLFNQSFAVVSQATALGAGTVVGGSGNLATAANTGYVSGQTPTGTVNWTATATATVFDAVGGVGTQALLGFAVFRHYPEQLSSPGTFWYQQVSVDAVRFRAASSSVTSVQSLGQNVFRTPSGAALASKAFSLRPTEAPGAGLSAALSGYCLVRCGASEPYGGFSGNFTGGNGNQWTYGQPTYFIIDHQGRIVSRIFDGAGPPNCGYQLSNNTFFRGAGITSTAWGSATQLVSLSAPLVAAPANDVSLLDITLPAWVQTNATSQSAYNTSTGVTYFVGQPSNIIMQPAAISLSLPTQAAYCPPVQAGPYTVLSGALTCIHDGRGVVEANYHFGTHNLIVTASTSTTGPAAGSAGTYYWCVVWEWYDSLGRVHRSTPSAPWPAVVPSGSYLTGASVLCPQPATAKTAVGGIMYARLYRSVLNNVSGIFYLVSTTAISAISATNYFATLTDGGTYLDASTGTVAGQQALTVQPRRYVDQAGLSASFTYASNPPPPFIYQVGAKGRIFGINQYQGQARLFYSSVQQGQVPFEWNQLNYAPIPPDIGDVRSLETIDDKVIVFGTRSNAVMSGDGPAGFGTFSGAAPSPNDGYSLIQPIPTPVGVVGTGSPARIPDGLIFQGFSGIQLVTRDLVVQPIGAAVDALTGRQVGNFGQVYGRAATLASLQSVVWCNTAGPALVYNYLTQKWSSWPLLAGACAIAQRLDGTVMVGIQPTQGASFAGAAQSMTAGADFGTLGTTWAPVYQGQAAAATTVLETPWILPSGESGGEAQLWDCTVTGAWTGPHVTQIEQAYDYAPAYTSSQRFTWATAPANYQMRVRPQTKSRMIAVRYRISLLPITTLGAGYQMATLGDLVLNFGSKQGTSRLGAPYSG